MLYLELGAAETARRTGLGDNTIRQWARRGNWQAAFKPERELPPSIRPTNVTGVTKPADALAEILAEDERETKLGLSRIVRRSIQATDSVELTDAASAHAIGKLASLVHGWEKDRGKVQVQVNLGFFEGGVS